MLHCPKCHATMRTFNRNGVQIEQCDGCRGIFLDYGELEALSRLEAQWAPPPPAPPPAPMPMPMHAPPVQYVAPAWGTPHYKRGHYHHKSFVKMLFSS